jgi:hypothetical protein
VIPSIGAVFSHRLLLAALLETGRWRVCGLASLQYHGAAASTAVSVALAWRTLGELNGLAQGKMSSKPWSQTAGYG